MKKLILGIILLAVIAQQPVHILKEESLVMQSESENIIAEELVKTEVPVQPVVAQPVEEVKVVAIATPEPKKAESTVLSRGGNVPDIHGKEVTLEVTAYCNCSKCSGNWGGITAKGTKTRLGIIAAPKEIPFDTQIYIEGLGVKVVEDRGGAIVKKKNGTLHIDLWMPSHAEALKFGRQTLKGIILEK